MKLRVAPHQASVVGRGTIASSDLLLLCQIAMFGVLIGLIGVDLAGLNLGGQVATIIACMGLLIFGLPHGSLDIAVLAGANRRGTRWLIGVISLYLGCAAAMYCLWWIAPVAALGFFLLLAMIHFAEDWRGDLPPFLAIGSAVAMLTSPVFLHRDALGTIFVQLTGSTAATFWVEIAMLIAPVALGAALVGIAATERRTKAIETATALLGMIVLPPIVGFALFFCLSHSPANLASAVSRARKGLFGYRYIEMVAVTLASLGMAALIFADFALASVTDGAIAASFITLSILTVPHMVAPLITGALDRRRRALA